MNAEGETGRRQSREREAKIPRMVRPVSGGFDTLGEAEVGTEGTVGVVAGGWETGGDGDGDGEGAGGGALAP